MRVWNFGWEKRLEEGARGVCSHQVIGTVSIYTLRQLLGGMEQLWVYPECKDIGS